MLSGINVVLFTMLAVLIMLYLLRRRTRLVTEKLTKRDGADGQSPTTDQAPQRT